ncbi:MAG: hypothetical protein QXW46_04350 [Sulfolobales archaeon]
MTSRTKLVIAIYIVLGIVMTATGFLLTLGANLGILTDNMTLRVLTLAAGFALVFIGVHISVAGLSSLRASAS